MSSFGYYYYFYVYYNNYAEVRYNTFRLFQNTTGFASVSGYLYYLGGGSPLTYKSTCTTTPSATTRTAAPAPPLPACTATTSGRAYENMSFSMRNLNGTVPVQLAYVYYGSSWR